MDKSFDKRTESEETFTGIDKLKRKRKKRHEVMAEFILGVPVLCWKNYTGIRGYQTAKQSNSRQSCVGKKKKKNLKTTEWKEHTKGGTGVSTEGRNNEQKFQFLCPLPNQHCPKGEVLQWGQGGPWKRKRKCSALGEVLKCTEVSSKAGSKKKNNIKLS